jgi:hypothetical protein
MALLRQGLLRPRVRPLNAKSTPTQLRMDAKVMRRPSTFDRVDRVKMAVGQDVLPHDDEIWILGQPMAVSVHTNSTLTDFCVPEGFTTDGASIPWMVQSILGWGKWDEPQRWAAIAHDYLYCYQNLAWLTDSDQRRWCDRVFCALLKSEGANPLMWGPMYAAVRVGGWPAFDADQEHGPQIFTAATTEE